MAPFPFLQISLVIRGLGIDIELLGKLGGT